MKKYLAFALLFAVTCVSASAQITTPPLIHISAEDIESSGTISLLRNFGSLAGTMSPYPIGNQIESVEGVQAITMNGSQGYVSDQAVPASLEGANPWTVHYRAYNPALAEEEVILSWAHRGGPDNTYAYYGFGANDDWGVAANWGGTGDMGFATEPAPSTWVDVVVTYDGATKIIYVDGVEDSTEATTLNIGAENFTGDPVISFGRGYNNDFTTFNPFTGSINLLQVFTEALNPTQVAELSTVDTPGLASAPIIKIDADGLTTGPSPLILTNEGTLGGVFNSDPISTGAAILETVDGLPAISMTGTNRFRANTGLVVPSNITGSNPWTVYAKVYQKDEIGAEEFVFEWGDRGGPDFTYGALVYGNNSNAWAVGSFWGGADLQFGTVPAADAWHDIAMTHENGIVNVYVDGVIDVNGATRALDIRQGVFHLGGHSDGLTSDISINVIEMFPVALSASEITQLPVGPLPNAAQTDWTILE